VNNTGAIVVGGATVTGGNLSLTSTADISQTGAISANLLTTSSVGGTVLNAANTVTSFNATNTTSGDISLTNTAAPLTITGISQSGGGNASVNNTGAIVVGGATVTGGNLSLTSSADISQTGAISANLLTTSSV